MTAATPATQQRLRHVDDDQNPVTGITVRDSRTERKRDSGRQHPHQPDETDRRRAAVPVCPDRDGQERRPLNHKEAAPRELEAPELPVPKDLHDGAGLVSYSMLQTPDRDPLGPVARETEPSRDSTTCCAALNASHCPLGWRVWQLVPSVS